MSLPYPLPEPLEIDPAVQQYGLAGRNYAAARFAKKQADDAKAWEAANVPRSASAEREAWDGESPHRQEAAERRTKMKREDIENATTSITIHVPRDISKRTRNPQECALAKACKKDVRIEEAVIHVSTAYIKFKGEEKWKRFRVPEGARHEIIRFDRTAQFTDGDYKLVPLQPSHMSRGKRQGTPGTLPLKPSPANRKQKPVHLKGVRVRANLAAP